MEQPPPRPSDQPSQQYGSFPSTDKAPAAPQAQEAANMTHVALEEANEMPKVGRTKRTKRLWMIALACIGITCAVTIGAVYGFRDTSSSSSSSPPSSSSSSTDAPPKTIKQIDPKRMPIVLMGDSNTEDGRNTGSDGWVGLLQNENTKTVQVINFGRSGDNTTNCIKEILPSVLDTLHTRVTTNTSALVAVFYGVNDAALLGGRYQEKHLSLDTFRDNLIYMVSEIRKAAPNATILLITPPVVDDDTRYKVGLENGAKPEDPLDRSNEQAGLYADVSIQVATQLKTKDKKVELLDLYGIFMKKYPQKQDRAVVLEDGLHFSKIGHRILYQELQKLVDKLVPAPVPAAMTKVP